MTEVTSLDEVRRYWALISRRRALIGTCVGVGLLAAVLHNYTTRPVYEATSQILIDRGAPKVLPNQGQLETDQPATDYYQTQYQLLAGRALTEKVVERLGLQKSPEFQVGSLMSPWERFQRKFLGRAPRMETGDGIPLSPAATAFRSRVTIEPLPGGRLVNVRFRAYEPALAAQAANGLAELYIEQSLEFRYTTSTEATAWLSDRLADQRKKVDDAERALETYREQHGLLNLEERQGLADQKLATFSGAVLRARTERIAKETVYNEMVALTPSQLEASPAVMTSRVVQELRSKVLDLQREQARLSETLGEKHPEMIRVRSDLKAAEDRLRAEVRDFRRAVEGDYRTALAQESRLEASRQAAEQEVLAINRRAIEFNALKREVESNQQVLKDLMGRSKETGLESELKSTNLRIVEKAEVPKGPVLPRRMRNYQLALLIGLAAGLGLALLFERLDDTVKTPDDVKHLGLPFLGFVPAVEGPHSAHGPKLSVRSLGDRRTPVSEAYNVLRTNLVYAAPGDNGRALLVSSAVKGEGKTTTAANLATTLALNGAKVLLMDADLRRPALHEHFRIPRTPGLSDLVVGKVRPSEVVHATEFEGLHVMPCGHSVPNPAEILGSSRMREVIEALHAHYEWLLIDTPPVLMMADMPVLCPLVDGVVLVIAANETAPAAVRRALEQIRGVGGKVTGAVLNRVDFTRNAYYYQQHYGEHYRAYAMQETGRKGRVGRRA